MEMNYIQVPTLEEEQFTVPPYQGQRQPMQQPMPEQPMPEQPQGLLGRIGAGIKRSVQDPNFMDRLTIGLGGMTMNPNEALMGLAQNRINQRQKLGLINEQKNRTIEALKRLNTPQAMRSLQLLDAGGSISDAVKMAFAKPNKKYQIVDGSIVAINEDTDEVNTVFQGKQAPNVEYEIVDGSIVAINKDTNEVNTVFQGKQAPNVEYEIVDGSIVAINKDTNEVNTVFQSPEEKPDILPNTPLIQREEDDIAAYYNLSNIVDEGNIILKEFGYNEKTGEFTGNLKIGLTGLAEGKFGEYFGTGEVEEARQKFERFKTKLINDSLRLNKGIQTEGDAQRAAKELGDASTTKSAYAAMLDLMRINETAKRMKEQSINSRRERYRLSPLDLAQTVQWRIVK
jgi:hypothetical protein